MQPTDTASRDSSVRVRAITGFGLTSPDAAGLVAFYEAAFAAKCTSSQRMAGPHFEHLMGVSGGASSHRIEFGNVSIDVLQFDVPGKPYPQTISPYDTAFQHFAIVVSDMARALKHLLGIPGWSPLSTEGPQRLPLNSGGVTAFKFQDPDGHPLELLEFPQDTLPIPWRVRRNGPLFMGIDHSALSVRDTAVSRTFYQSLGFLLTGETQNEGKEQALLDGVANPVVEVSALSAPLPTPHVELLCYRCESDRSAQSLASNDVATSRILMGEFRIDNAPIEITSRRIVDPDGHHVLITPRNRPLCGVETEVLATKRVE